MSSPALTMPDAVDRFLPTFQPARTSSAVIHRYPPAAILAGKSNDGLHETTLGFT